MPLYNPKIAYADGPAATNLVTVNETVVATTPAIDTTPEGDQVVIEAAASVTTGATTSSIQARVRRGGLAGPQVGPTYTRTIGAALTDHISMQVADVPGEVAEQVYVLTIQQVAATGNGTANAASIQAMY